MIWTKEGVMANYSERQLEGSGNSWYDPKYGHTYSWRGKVDGDLVYMNESEFLDPQNGLVYKRGSSSYDRTDNNISYDMYSGKIIGSGSPVPSASSNQKNTGTTAPSPKSDGSNPWAELIALFLVFPNWLILLIVVTISAPGLMLDLLRIIWSAICWIAKPIWWLVWGVTWAILQFIWSVICEGYIQIWNQMTLDWYGLWFALVAIVVTRIALTYTRKKSDPRKGTLILFGAFIFGLLSNVLAYSAPHHIFWHYFFPVLVGLICFACADGTESNEKKSDYIWYCAITYGILVITDRQLLLDSHPVTGEPFLVSLLIMIPAAILMLILTSIAKSIAQHKKKKLVPKAN
jgi:hypothetical protein